MVCTCYDPIIMKIILSRGGKEPEGNIAVTTILPVLHAALFAKYKKAQGTAFYSQKRMHSGGLDQPFSAQVMVL